MIHRLTKVLESATVLARLTRTQAGIIFLPVNVTGTVTAVYVEVGANLPGSGSALFNLRKNGVPQWSGGTRLAIVAGARAGSKTSLAIGVTMNDDLHLDLEQMTSIAQVSLPIVITVLIDDGLGGGSTPYFNADRPPLLPHAKDDEFNAVSLDAAWTVYGGADVTVSLTESLLKLSRTSASNGISGVGKTIPSDDWDIIAKFIIPTPVPIATGSVQIGIALFEDVTNTAKKFYLIAGYDAIGTIGRAGLYTFTDRANLDSTISAFITAAIGLAAIPFGTFYYRLQKISSQYQAYMSLDGSHWWPITGLQSLSFTPLHVGVFADNTTGATRAVYCDYVRFYTTMPDYIGGSV